MLSKSLVSLCLSAFAGASLLSSVAVAAPAPAASATSSGHGHGHSHDHGHGNSSQITCTPTYLGAGDGGFTLILGDSGATGTEPDGRGPYSNVGRLSPSSNEATTLVTDEDTKDYYRFYACSSNSLGVKAKEGSINYGLLVLENGNKDNGMQCIQTRGSPPEEDHSEADLVVGACSLDDTYDKQDRQFFSVDDGTLIWKFRGNPQFPNFLDGGNASKGSKVQVRQGVTQNKYNGFQFADSD